MTISLAGAIGGLLGFVLAWLDWKAVSGILRNKHQAKALTLHDAQARKSAEQKLNALLAVIFVVFFIGFPVIGYLTGAQIAG
ncbi:MAG: hypothetical protein C0606_02295 [Hyphomicrobiales bacterium]|nr:MAG: hypothetical protein C0606_02295 [Hyphomicrobiales bacterium]